MSATRTRVWGDRPAAAAAAVIAVMVVWRGILLKGSYFNQDDFYLTARGARTDLTWDFLFEPFSGHIFPAQQLNFWLVGQYTPFRWDVVAAEILLLQLLATLAAWHLLTRLLPGRWARVPLLAAFAWSPLTVMPTLWWSGAMVLWPHVLFSVLAMLFLVRARQGVGPSWLNQVLVVLCFLAGLSFFTRAVLIVPVLLGLAVAIADEARGWRRIVAALRRFWLLWLVLVGLLATFLVVRERLAPAAGGASSWRAAAEIAGQYLGRSVAPGLVGGPWSAEVRGGAVGAAPWVVVASILLVIVAVALLLARGGPARVWALLLLVGYVLADLTLLVTGRGSFGSVIALDPRYSADILHVAVVVVALALRGSAPRTVPARAGDRRRWWVAGATAVVAAAYVAGTVVGTALLVPHFQNTEDRAYVSTFRESLALDPNQVILDGLVPADVVLPLVGNDSLLSRVFASLPESPAFDEPSPRVRVVDDDGRLLPVELDGSVGVEPGPDPGCGYSVQTLPVEVPFVIGVQGDLVAEVDYFTDSEHVVEVGTDDWTETFLANPGPNKIWVPIPDAGEEIEALRFRVQEFGSAVCVADLRVGRPERP